VPVDVALTATVPAVPLFDPAFEHPVSKITFITAAAIHRDLFRASIVRTLLSILVNLNPKGSLASDPVRLVCLDLDGTLVGSGGKPTDGVWKAADRARAAGLHLAVCTARLGSGSAWEWAQRLDPNGWHQFQTGASLMHTGTGDVRLQPLSGDAVAACQALAVANDWIFEAYANTDYIVDSSHPVAESHAGLLGIPYVHRSLGSLDGAALRVQFIVPDTDLDECLAACPEDCWASGATSPIIPGWNFVSITVAGVSKASGVAALAELAGCSVQQTMMVGDGHNDIPAMQTAGYAVAMGNAHPDVFTVAGYRVASVDDDGVAEALDLALTLM
jgi:Cof subfamily protein (haloacid dehalogenase superfamily)